MPDASKSVTYVNFTDAEGTTIDVPTVNFSDTEGTIIEAPPQIPADLAPPPEHPLRKIMREQYEQQVRSAFARGQGHTIPNVQWPGATWSDAIDMGWEWLTEAGQDRKVYRDGTPQVQDMKCAHRVNEAREYFYRKNDENLRAGQSLEPVTNYSGSFYPVGVIRAGNNPTQQFIGSYNIDIYPTRDNTVTFVLTNVTSLKSGTYHIGPEYPRGKVGLGGNQTQIYTWTEPRRPRAVKK